MYAGTNPTALRSQTLLVDAMFTLLQHDTFADITVSQLTQEAQLSRQTFYQIFTSKEDVIKCRIQGLFVEFQQTLSRQPITLHALITLFFAFYQKYATIFNLLLDNHLEPLLTTYAQDCMASLQLTTEKNNHYSHSFIAAGLTQILVDWHSHQDTDIEEVAQLVEQLLNPNAITK
ncbi:MAG: TetR/AcrR family transcriptional regulator [Lactobacillus sp.]|jgi:AcrR family transcriptional regulator|nr:MAG: TetR/AcrR family transcriptional regulator [Lactobacillus sp.]